ncbi:MAG: hypothetical protein Q4C70_01145 [Planctomycetia bacterium]|nr:hypothetical protein [Planctomycetia bacterium]
MNTLQPLRRSDISHLTGFKNWKGKRFFREILKSRTEEEVAEAWRAADVAEEDWRLLNEIARDAGIFNRKYFFLPDDEVGIILGHWLKRIADNMETETFAFQCEGKFHRNLSENGVQICSENMTLLEFWRILMASPKGKPKKIRITGYAIMDIFLLALYALGMIALGLVALSAIFFSFCNLLVIVVKWFP